MNSFEQSPGSPEPPAGSGPVDGPAARPPGSSAIRRRGSTVAIGTLAVAAVVLGSLAFVRSSSRSAPATPRPKVVLASAQTSALTTGATITVTGSGSIEGTPDSVSFTIGIHTTGPTATGTLDTNNAQVQSLETTLEHHGIAAKEMQTSSLAVYDNTNSSGLITGFSVDDDLNVTMTDVTAAGDAIDAAAQAVGNGINLYGISFSISNESRLLAKARASAMLNARTEAEQVAQGAGLTLGPVVKVTDLENANSSPYFGGVAFSAASSDNLALQAGRQPVSVQVSVVYQLRG